MKFTLGLMASVAIRVLISLALLGSCRALAADNLYEQYVEMLKLSPLESEIKAKAGELGVRLVEEDGAKISSYTIAIGAKNGGLRGDISVCAQFSGKLVRTSINRRDLSEQEIGRIIDLVSRGELLFLPRKFTPIMLKPTPENISFSVELVSLSLSRSNIVTRSIAQTDSVQNLRDWVVAMANSPNDQWQVERR